MTKLSARGKNRAGNGELVFYKKWHIIVNNLDQLIAEGFDGMIKNCKRTAAERLHAAISCDEKLGGEQLYEQYRRLIEAYGRIAQSYQSSARPERDQLAAVASGIVGVLRSRVRSFTDFRQSVYSSGEDAAVNPVALERKELGAGGILDFSKHFNILTDKLSPSLLNPLLPAGRKVFLTDGGYQELCAELERCAGELLEKLGPELHQLYESTAAKIVSELNNLNRRRIAAYCLDALKEEYNVLNSIIIVQVAALEGQLSLGAGNAAVTNLLYDLRDVYQYLGLECSRVISGFEQAAAASQSPELDTAEDFISQLSDGLSITELLPEDEFELHKEEFRSRFEELRSYFTGNLLSEDLRGELGFFYKKKVYELKKESNELLTLCSDVSFIFEGLVLAFKTMLPVIENSKDFDIMKGIDETIEIKLESLKEACDLFREDCAAVFADKEDDITLDLDGNESGADCFDALIGEISAMGKDDRRILLSVRQAVSGFEDETSEKLRLKIEKNFQQQYGGFTKKITAFERDSLLFEFVTFEEIMNYSVAKIRENPGEAEKRYTAMVDGVKNRLFSLLARYGIEAIHPEPHEVFSAKEHEVLIAEPNTDFKKGEIIKLVNQGYKHNGKVIIRANIIACK